MLTGKVSNNDCACGSVAVRFITHRIRRMGEGNVFSLFTPGGGGGTLARSRREGGVPTPRYLPPAKIGTPTPVKVGTPPPGQVGTGGGGGTLRYLPPSQSRYPSPPRTAYGVLDMLRSVCLLRSRRRTFLLFLYFKLSSSFFAWHKLHFWNLPELCAIEFDRLHKDITDWIETHKENSNNKPAVLIVEGFILFNYK